MKNTIFTALFALLLTSNLSAQREETLFSSPEVRLSGIWGGVSYNYSYFDSDFTSVRGGFGGIEISRKVFLGFAGYEFRHEARLEDGEPFTLSYSGFMAGYTPDSYRAVHPRLSLLAAGGRARIDYDNRGDRVFVLQPSAGIEINATQWFRVGLEAGYRLVTYDDIPGIGGNELSSPFAQVDLRFGLSWGR